MKFYVKDMMLYEMESDVSGEDVVIPDEVIHISAHFKHRFGIIGSINTNNAMIVGRGAFDESSHEKAGEEEKGIERIVFGKSIHSIGVCAFSGCRDLKEVIFPNENRELEIHPYAFSGCKIKDTLLIRNPDKLYKYSLSQMEIGHLIIENPSRIGPEFLSGSKVEKLTISSCLALLTPDIFKGALIKKLEIRNCPLFHLELWKKHFEELQIKCIEPRPNDSLGNPVSYNEEKNRMLVDYFEVLLSNGFQEVYGFIGPFDNIARNATHLTEKKNLSHSEIKEIMRYDPYVFMDDAQLFEESLENGSLNELLDDLV